MSIITVETTGGVVFSVFGRKSWEPPKPEGHEGNGTAGRVAFSNAVRSREEGFDLIETLQAVLRAHGFEASRRNGWLVLGDGLHLRPEILAVTPLESGGVRTATTIAIAHQTAAPHGLFEYQYAHGNDTNAALGSGFGGWVEIDLPVLRDAVGNSQAACTAMDMECAEPAPHVRRALLGPVSHLAGRRADAAEAHPFCPCCLLTHTMEAFRPLLKDQAFYGVRLLAARDAEGVVSADCRVNGIDWEEGRELLLRYGATWPDRGFEMRKQYVVIYTRAGGTS